MVREAQVSDRRVADSVGGVLDAVASYLGRPDDPAVGPVPRLLFWGVWPLKCGCGVYVGRLAWGLGDGETTRWVEANVSGHVCECGPGSSDGAVVQCTVNDRPTHNTIHVSEQEYARVQRLAALAGPSKTSSK